MVFHYSSIPILFVTERYALILAVLFVDKWLAHEYIVNTNSCVAVLALSLLVHELRDAGVQERLHGDVAHNVILSLLVISNILVLTLGEHQTIFHAFSLSNQAVGLNSEPSSVSDANNKRPRQPFHPHDTQGVYGVLFNSKTPPAIGALTCVVGVSILLVLLSTCAMPVSTHDPFLNNLRVWSFTVLSLTWLYTVNYRDLRYSIVAPFTPCLLRFSCVLFFTPTPLAIVGVLLMATFLTATYMWLNKTQQAQCDTISQDTLHYGCGGDSVAVVVRDTKSHASTGSIISYRTPCAVQEKRELLVVGAKPTTAGPMPSLVRSQTAETLNCYSDKGDDLLGLPIADTSLDYGSMFLQALNERVET